MNALTPAFVAQASTALTQPTAVFQPGPDAELIDACIDFMNLERQWLRLCYAQSRADKDTPAIDSAMDVLTEQQQPLVDRICELRPATHYGAVNIARALSMCDHTIFKKAGPGHCTNDRFVAALVAGLIWKRPEPAGADAALLEACDTFHRHQTAYDVDPGDGDETEWCQAGRQAHAAFLVVQGIVPTTEAGHRAKAQVALAKLEENHGGGMAGDPYAAFALTLLRDWLGSTTSAPRLPSPDVELLALQPAYDSALAACEAYERVDSRTLGFDHKAYDAETGRLGMLLNDACDAIRDAPPAVTDAGRRLKATVALLQMEFADSRESLENGEAGEGPRTAWDVLRQIAGDAYRPYGQGAP